MSLKRSPFPRKPWKRKPFKRPLPLLSNITDAPRGLRKVGGKPKRRKPMLYKVPRPESHRALRDELDRLFREHIMERDGYACATCGNDDPQMLTCSHIFGRVNENARWHSLNAVCQCKSENEAHNSNKQPLFDYFIGKHGREMFDSLYRLWNTVEKLTYIETLNLRDEYKALLRKAA